MGVVADIERKLARQRCRQEADGDPELRTSTMTHVVWCPPRWLPRAKRVLAGLAERHPARTIFLIPVPGRSSGVEASAVVRDFAIGDGREVLSEVIELRLRGDAAQHPASIVLPLLISDLPAFCRWRGEPDWDGQALAEIVDVCDRLVVDSSEWPGIPGAYARGRTPLRAGGRLGHRLAADACVAGRAGGVLAGDQEDRAPAGRGASGRRPPARRMASLAPPPRHRPHAPQRPVGDLGPDRRRSRRPAFTGRALRKRPPLRRARQPRARPGLRGCGPRRRLVARADRHVRRSAAGRRHGVEQGAVQVPVRGDRASPVHPVLAGEVGERAARLLDDHLDRCEVPDRHADGVDRPVDRPLGDQHVAPEVAVAAGMPRASDQGRERLLEREAEDGVLGPVHRGDVDTIASGVRAAAPLGPPAPVEGRRGDDAERDPSVLLERDQRRPHRDPARVVARPVDRVDDPAAPPRARRTLLLAQDRVPPPLDAQHRPHLVLDRPVGLRDRRPVGLRLDQEVTGAKAPERDRVGRVGEPQRELEVRAHARPASRPGGRSAR